MQMSTRLGFLAFVLLMSDAFKMTGKIFRVRERGLAAVVAPELQQQSNEAWVNSVFVGAVRSALQGDFKQLDAITGAGAQWDSPVAGNLADLKSGLTQFASFFQDPVLTVYGARSISSPPAQQSSSLIEIEYQLSFWWPLPWRPRINIPAKAVITLDTSTAANNIVSSVVEKWQPSLLDIFFKQVVPRAWDVWHLFSSPVPEFPPLKELGRVGKVTMVEVPPTLVYEARWTGLAKYPGPPLLTLPGFAFVGDLRTSRPNRDPFFTVLPIEAQTDAFLDPITGKEMKQTIWTVPVPSALITDPLVQSALAGTASVAPSIAAVDLEKDDGSGGASGGEADDKEAEADFVTMSLDRINLMKSVTGGVLRGEGLRFDQQMVDEYRQAEKVACQYRVQPRRLVARVPVRGEVTSEKISAALNEIRAAVNGGSFTAAVGSSTSTSSSSSSQQQQQRRLKMKRRSMDSYSDSAYSPQVGLSVGNCKACFNAQAKLAMGIYEIQFDKREAEVFVELVGEEEK